MKNLIFALLVLVGLSQAQIVTIGGRTQWGDSLRWGDSNDSTGYLRARGNAVVRDSSGTWLTITTDSCSLPLRMGFTTTPDSKLELSYEVRTSSGNTDSSQVKLRFDSRYCRGITDTTKCESWVPAGRFKPDTSSQIIDSLITVATASGTTWKPTRQLFDVPGGNQIRACIDGYSAGGEATDSTFFRRFVIRNSSIPAGGTPPTSLSISGGTSLVDDAAFTVGTSSTTPAAGVYRSTLDSVNDGDAGALGMTINRSLRVHLVDAAGDAQAVGGGTQYAEDAAHASGNTGNLVLGVRRDTPASSTITDGDNATLNTDANGRLWASATIDAALPAGTNNIGDVDVLSSALPTGAATAAKQPALGTAGASSADVISVQGIASGTALPVSIASVPSHAVTNAGTFAVQAAQSGTWTVQPGNTANTTPWLVDGSGVTQPVSAASLPLPTGAATSANQSTGNTSLGTIAGAVAGTEMQVDVLTMPTVTINSPAVTNAGTFAVQAAGAAANDAAASGGPVQTGGVAQTADPTVVTAGDAAYSLHTIGNKQVVMPYSISGSRWSYAAASGGIVNTTAVTVKAAAAAGIKNCITSIQVINAHATVSTETLVLDGAAGTVLHRGWAQSAGGGYAHEFPVPICGTAATLLEVDNVTTGAAVYYNLQGYISAE